MKIMPGWSWRWILAAVLVQSCWFRAASAKSRSNEMTVRVEAGRKECFFVDQIVEGLELALEYEVTDTDGPTGNFDITAQIKDPAGEVMQEEYRSGHGGFMVTSQKDGDHQFCLDNSYSTFSSKVISFTFTVRDPADDYYEDYLDSDELESMRGMDRDYEDTWDMTADELKRGLNYIRMSVREIAHSQERLQFSYSQDMKMAEKNAEKVTMWSLVHLSFLLAVGVIQVFMVQSLFSDKSFKYKMERLHSRLTGGDGDGFRHSAATTTTTAAAATTVPGPAVFEIGDGNTSSY